MVTVFCLRLALGMVFSTTLVWFDEAHPRFYRVQFLTVMALLFIAGLFWGIFSLVLSVNLMVAAGMFGCFATWTIWERWPRLAFGIWLVSWAIVVALLFDKVWPPPGVRINPLFRPQMLTELVLADNLTSAILLGSTISAMLMGHSYLLAPTASLTPLMRLLAAIGVGVALRFALWVYGLVQWVDGADRYLVANSETMLFLGVRGGAGLFGVLVLTWMAWESARIRSTQSATGILYVAVVLCFLGELASQFLVAKTGFTL